MRESTNPRESFLASILDSRSEPLPEQTRGAAPERLAQLEALSAQIQQFKRRLKEQVALTAEITLPTAKTVAGDSTHPTIRLFFEAEW